MITSQKKTMINLSPDSRLQANSPPETFPTYRIEIGASS
jgi:hypothetical protein